MIVVTGAAGFVGQNLVKLLNSKGITDIILVDTLSKKNYFKNLIGLQYCDFLNFEKGIKYLEDVTKNLNIKVIFHMGANADVLINDCNIMMDMNFEHSKFWFNIARDTNIPFIYASSSAVYGNNNSFKVRFEDEKPHNEYAFSKLAFDNYVRNYIDQNSNQIVGYRFFNIFGMGELHKDKNASLPYRFFNFIIEKGYIDLFDKEIKRDYVWVEDVCNILYKTWKSEITSGIYNLGSGQAISHNDLANLIIDTMIEENVIKSSNDLIQKVPMPDELVNKFQYLTYSENTLEWILSITRNGRVKIRNYIKELSKEYKNAYKK